MERSMTVKERILAGALTALFILVLVAAYVALVIIGKAPVEALLAVLSSLLATAVGLVSVFAGHTSATTAAAQATGATPGTQTFSTGLINLQPLGESVVVKGPSATAGGGTGGTLQ
jgi:hypothetical protein